MLMPLHDWSRLPEWEGVHHLWISELYRYLKATLPPGFRARIACVPSLTIGETATRPDVIVQQRPDEPANAASDEMSGFETEVALLALDPTMTIRIYRGSDLVAALELISPSNKNRESSRAATVNRIVGYLAMGVHVLFVDVHPAPQGFSLADAVATVLEYEQPPCPAPHAMAYQVCGRVDGGGQSVAIRRAPLTVGQPLPTLPLPLGRSLRVDVELEATYTTAARDYLSWPSYETEEG
jgi:hypothetical protein